MKPAACSPPCLADGIGAIAPCCLKWLCATLSLCHYIRPLSSSCHVQRSRCLVNYPEQQRNDRSLILFCRSIRLTPQDSPCEFIPEVNLKISNFALGHDIVNDERTTIRLAYFQFDPEDDDEEETEDYTDIVSLIPNKARLFDLHCSAVTESPLRRSSSIAQNFSLRKELRTSSTY